jgi:hypothetical protein
MEKRALRRHHMFRIQRKRSKEIKHQFIGWLTEGENYRWSSFWQSNRRPIDAGFFERLRWNHFGCGCKGCKPWKHFHGKNLDYKISERRRLQTGD